MALEQATDRAPHWPVATYAAILEGEGAAIRRRCLIVAMSAEGDASQAEGKLVGFAVAACMGRVAEIESVVVEASSRRTGIGRALCAAILEWCRSQGAAEVVLEVRAGSADAIALYAGLDFVETGRRARYYSEPEEDAILMQRGLP